MIDRQADEDAGKSSGYHSEEVAEVKVGGITVQVSGETVLNACTNEPGGETKEFEHAHLSNTLHLTFILKWSISWTGQENIFTLRI